MPADSLSRALLAACLLASFVQSCFFAFALVPDPDDTVHAFLGRLALDGDGLPVVSFLRCCGNARNDLKLLFCGQDDCWSDQDKDGCPDTAEEQTDLGTEVLGGRRSPTNPYDYFDASHNGQVRINDVVLVLNAYYHDDNDANPGLPPYAPGYMADRDRTYVGPNLWNLGPPNGLQRIDDVLHEVHQYFHDCVYTP